MKAWDSIQWRMKGGLDQTSIHVAANIPPKFGDPNQPVTEFFFENNLNSSNFVFPTHHKTIEKHHDCDVNSCGCHSSKPACD